MKLACFKSKCNLFLPSKVLVSGTISGFFFSFLHKHVLKPVGSALPRHQLTPTKIKTYPECFILSSEGRSRKLAPVWHGANIKVILPSEGAPGGQGQSTAWGVSSAVQLRRYPALNPTLLEWGPSDPQNANWSIPQLGLPLCSPLGLSRGFFLLRTGQIPLGP